MLEEIENARWKLAPGLDAETGLSLSATSRIAHAFDVGGVYRDNPWCAFAVFDGKGEWRSAADAKNHAEAALSPTIAYCRVRNEREEGSLQRFDVPFVVGLTADLRSRWGTFEEGEGDNKQTAEGNQTVAGAGVTVLFPNPPSWLQGFELTTSYYQVIDSEGGLTAPKELEVDHLQARLKSRILFPFKVKALENAALVVDGRGSWALEGPDQDEFEPYISLGLELGSKKTAATLRWESGKEVGFEYDEKLVIGVVLRLLGLERGGS